MIKLDDGLWIGAAVGPEYGNLKALGIGAILNSAQDLQSIIGWENGVEYMQVGLIDGPGNPTGLYYAAVLALDTLLKRHKNVLVCCHEGGRSLATAVMYLQATTFTHGWDGWISILRERVDVDLPTPHPAHREAFDKMNWRLLKSALGD